MKRQKFAFMNCKKKHCKLLVRIKVFFILNTDFYQITNFDILENNIFHISLILLNLMTVLWSH